MTSKAHPRFFHNTFFKLQNKLMATVFRFWSKIHFNFHSYHSRLHKFPSPTLTGQAKPSTTRNSKLPMTPMAQTEIPSHFPNLLHIQHWHTKPHNPPQVFSPNNLQPKPKRQNGHARSIWSFMSHMRAPTEPTLSNQNVKFTASKMVPKNLHKPGFSQTGLHTKSPFSGHQCQCDFCATWQNSPQTTRIDTSMQSVDASCIASNN